MHDVEEEVAIIAPIFTSCAADPKKKKREVDAIKPQQMKIEGIIAPIYKHNLGRPSAPPPFAWERDVQGDARRSMQQHEKKMLNKRSY